MDEMIKTGIESSEFPVEHIPESEKVELRKIWLSWSANALERLPWRYSLTVIIAMLLATGEQILEYWIETNNAGVQPAVSLLRLAVFPMLVVYILGHFAFVKRVSVKALLDLRPSVKVNNADYEKHVRRLISASPRIEFFLFFTAVMVVTLLFFVLQGDLLNTNSSLPRAWLAAAYVFSMYVFLGWLLLELVYNSIRQARALANLAQCPLIINVFDPVHLLPFGRLGLVLSLPIVGIVLIPLILFGAPTMGGYLVIAISGVSFLALFVPLWGVHEQIDLAQNTTLNEIHHQLQQIHNRLIPEKPMQSTELTVMNDRMNLLLQLRKTVMEAPSWPFKDTADVARAIIAVTSPLIYFVLTELIKTYIMPLLSGTPVP